MNRDNDTIAAPATAPGGAIAVIRISGAETFSICGRLFRGRKPLAEAASHTLHYGRIMEGARTIDDVLLAVFRAPHSYTGEDSAEISCHGSPYIVSEILRLLLAAGARMAEPGEFTVRAYLAGKLDLAQAEAVADLVAASSRAAHALASEQMRGGYSATLDKLRDRLLQLASMLELELDFAEEEVEFADRGELCGIMGRIDDEIERLRQSFSLGNALKEGVAVAIVGAPNTGKSTLLNRLLDEDRAMVSEIAGTTRDVIEERINIDGVLFRFLDTAGLHATQDRLERMGIERTLRSISRARIVLRLLDAAEVEAAGREHRAEEVGETGRTAEESHSVSEGSAGSDIAGTDGASENSAKTDIPEAAETAAARIRFAESDFPLRSDQTLLTVVNKLDLHRGLRLPAGALGISARNGEGIDALRAALRATVDTEALYHGDTTISNSRHYEALTAAHEALQRALAGAHNGLPTELLSEEVREVIRHVGNITGRGAIVPDEILTHIFSKFCIGK